MKSQQTRRSRIAQWFKATKDPRTREYLHLSIALILIGSAIVIITWTADKIPYGAFGGGSIGAGLGGIYTHIRDRKQQKSEQDSTDSSK
ncbi:MAG: hypothetical protein IJM56_06685 [Clostridia bacterium]|nr:hypothetical protein [Clostridia bacterium]MBQ9408721.1 hypothetical protein [Clostridia bacterium]